MNGGPDKRKRGAVLAAVLACASLLLGAATGTASSTGAPGVGSAASEVDLQSVPGTVPYEEGWAVPLRGEQPDWLTPERREEARDANGQPVAAPNDAPLPSEVGIRPGSWMVSPYGCTMNFVFQKSATLGIGTAGHCTDQIGQAVILLTLAPGTENPVLVTRCWSTSGRSSPATTTGSGTTSP